MFTITDTKKFKAAHKIALAAIDKKSTMPILHYFRFFGTDQGAFIRATDLETTATIDITDTIEYSAPFDFLVPFKRLSEALKAQKSGFSVSAHIQDGREFVKIGALTVQTLPVDEFPIVPDVQSIPASVINLSGTIKQALYAAGVSDTRYVLNGALIDITEKKIVCTDGHRMTIAPLDICNYFSKGRAIIARKTCEVLSLMPGNAMMCRDKDKAVFHFDKLTGSPFNAAIFARLIDGKYPDYKQVADSAKKENHIEMTVNRADFIGALDVVSGVLDRKGRNYASLYFSEGQAVLYAYHPDNGKARATTAATYTGTYADTPIVLNVRFLKECFSAMSGDVVTITSRENEPLAPIMLSDGTESVSIIMPVRDNNARADVDALYYAFPEHVKAAMQESIRHNRITRKLAERKQKHARADMLKNRADALVYAGAFHKALKIYQGIGAIMQYRELLECLPDLVKMAASDGPENLRNAA